MTTHSDVRSPVELAMRRKSRTRRAVVLIVLGAVASLVYLKFFVTRVDDFDEIEMHFKYGSIGSELSARTYGEDEPLHGGHLPYRLWRVLPLVFEEYLPQPPDLVGASELPHRRYEAFGFLFEEGKLPEAKDRPIGFSLKEYRGLSLMGLNCAVCHTGAVRTSATAPRELLLAGPSVTLNLLDYFNFLFDCALDSKFSSEYLLPAIEADTGLNLLDRFIFGQILIPRVRAGILQQRHYLSYVMPGAGLKDINGEEFEYPAFGPGTVDTFNSVKAIRFHNTFDMSQTQWVGTTDFPSVYMQVLRDGISAHWDGNTDSVDERNLSAALAGGAEPDTVDVPRIDRVKEWMKTLCPPRYPFDIDEELAEKGAPIYRNLCASCHGYLSERPWSVENFEPNRVGEVIQLSKIGTDPNRLHSFSQELSDATRQIGEGKPWQFSHFRKTDGYVNAPLDGLWVRAPYFHNGSVPTLWHTLLPAESRPTEFYRGSEMYDADLVGFAWQEPTDSLGKNLFRHDVEQRGKGNAGHSGAIYGTELVESDRLALLEYLKTL